nr:NHL repeat protein [uncultured bacterium]AXL05815.1 NHL repeat protein [uncultured bacterium]
MPPTASWSYGDVRTRDLSDGSVRTRVSGLRRPAGLAVRGDGVLVVAEAGAGRVVAIDADDVVTVLAEGLASPVDVAFDGEQGYVSDEERGAVLRLDDGSPVAEGLSAPQGLAVRDGEVLVETGRRRLLAIDPGTGGTRVEADDLAVGLPPGVTRTDPALFSHGMSGVPRQFAGLAVGPDGTPHVSANAQGGVLRIDRSSHDRDPG